MPEPPTGVIQGPTLFENWRAARQGQDLLGGYECPLYSDAWIVGEESIGPYRFINTIAHASGFGRGAIAPVLVLRVGLHMQFGVPQMNKTDTSKYHGGSLSDEAASLAALALGARVEAGPTTREFEQGDACGKPVAYYGYGTPILSQDKLGPRLPWAVGRHSLEDLRWFAGWFEADPSDQIALIRAARLYQEAIWIADAEPALAWLLLVSAIETAANRWDQSTSSATDRLRDAKPALVEAVETRCPDILPIIADGIADSIGATRKFVDFTLKFLPRPPGVRPAEGFQVRWDDKHLRQDLRRIYGYRSKALHTGVPFPAPMCEPPVWVHRDWAAPVERPLGLATSTCGGVWLQQDTPMLLHIFEYIARKALQSWWSSLRLGRNGTSEALGSS